MCIQQPYAPGVRTRDRKAKAEPLLQKVEEYLLNRRKCRRVQLLDYLGETCFTAGRCTSSMQFTHGSRKRLA